MMAFMLLIAATVFLSYFTTGKAQVAGPMRPVKALSQKYYHPCPLPGCEECPSVEKLRAPGVGFALEMDYGLRGAAVVRLHDGSSRDIALIEGETDFTTLMGKFATGPINREPDLFDTNWEKLQYIRKRAKRLSNKLLGRPATPETAILASMVSKLVKATQTWLDNEQGVIAAVLSSPDRVALSDEEIGDIFDYLKIKNLMKEIDLNPLHQLYATSAAYAGYGKGLCYAYLGVYECEREEWNFPVQRVLHLSLNHGALSGTIKGLKTAKDGSVSKSFVDPDLGLGNVTSLTTDDEFNGKYWAAVSHRIRELAKTLEAYAYMPQITELLLTGPWATNERFQSAVKDSLHDFVGDKNVLGVFQHSKLVASDGVGWRSLFGFAAARGAAEIAKRRQEGPVNCAQSGQCKRKREVVHGRLEIGIVKQPPEL